MRAVIGIDIGGTGSRLAVADLDRPGEPPQRTEGEHVRITPGGSNAADVAAALVRAAAARWPARVAAAQGVCVGATGLASLVDDPAEFASRLRSELDAVTALGERGAGARSPAAVVVAVDAATAHAGALRGEAGVVVALGTGAVAFGTDWASAWRRVDGWGHLLGDRGGGAWIGLRAAVSAMRAFDGVDVSGAVLLAAVAARLGDPCTWPRQLYTSDDRAGILAALVPDVVACAQAGDAAAAAILTEAGRQAARSAAAALDPDLPPRIAGTGGVFRSELVRDAFIATLRAARPHVGIVTGGDPLDGAVILAGRASALRARPPFLWLAP